jgi:hypothetical protein
LSASSPPPLLLAAPSPVRGDTFGNGPPNEGYQADSALHTYCYGPGFNDNLEGHADYAMGTSLDADTDIADSFVACDASTDAEWLDMNLTDGNRGVYICTALVGSICFSSDVILDPAEIDEGTNDFWDRAKTACHEAGHSVGLRHGGTTDCMLSGEVPDTSVQYRRYNTHHRVDHINATY